MTEADSKVELKAYFAVVSYDISTGNPTQVFARDEAHAREILTNAGKNMKNFTIVDLVDLDQIDDRQKQFLNGQVEKEEDKESVH